MDIAERVRSWRVPLGETRRTVRELHDELASFGLEQHDVPFLVQLIENPRYDLPGVDIFNGATDLARHDRIHILLGRGLMAKDEAFVIGFTMGSTDRVSQTEEQLFGFFSRYLYPRRYRFSESDFRVFRDAVRLGFISDCQRLDRADFEAILDLSPSEARKALGIEERLLRAYFEIEKRRYPDSPESQRLLD
jgi:hypothetical protein